MSVSYTINMSSLWTEEVQESGNINNISSDAGNLVGFREYLNGTGSGSVNQQYHEYRTLQSGGTRNYDLRSITGSLLGNSVTKTFSKIKAISIKNYNTVTGHNISIGVNSSSGFGEPFGNPTGVITLTPWGHIGHNTLFGWTTSAQDCQLLITNLANTGVSYEISIAGEA